jgi:hypothetical protein
VKTNNKVVAFVFISAFSWIIFTGLIQSHQDTLISEKTTTPLPYTKNNISQKKGKYLYVGMEKCASVCHNNKDMGFQYDMVKSSPHANAFHILLSRKAYRYAKKANIKENPRESPVCLKCHVTGGGLDSSFFSASYRKDDGVTCEACHKGAYITKTFIPKEEDCLKCHNGSVHKIRIFNFKQNCVKIAHPRPVPKLKET